MSDTNVKRAGRLDTATISDAMDKLGIAGQCLGIKPLSPDFRFAGRAVTFRYTAAAKPAGSVGDYIDDVPPGSVIVLDNGGREDATVWGDILTSVAHRRGVAGTLIDGACRDTDLARSLGYPVFSRSYSMRTGKDRVQLEAADTIVTIGAARVAPGDLVRGDADGAVVLPRQHEEAILETAEAIEHAETAIRAALDRGLRLDEARRAHNYHALQRREQE
ncbi:RraA family protein [Hephaestia sp. GCM10023244]|uniref:RraA family protein n=1 Tax=unclassified Hephaestia TaxID=2631281 RepID=UPI00207767C6|nr:RraA family protein [Hephaestia sp. MAHUQ-44]MCM8732039.1 RraA family protein [Hephaestia sp. MAHUQ-44]